MSDDQEGVERAPDSPASSSLIEQVSHAAMWNAALVPLLGLFQLAFAVVVRRYFGLASGVYDVLIGLMATVLVHSGVAMPMALLKFLPEVTHTVGPGGAPRLLRDAVMARLLLLGLALGLVNIFAEPLANTLELGPTGPFLVRVLSAVAIARATIDMMVRALNAFFAQKWSNVIALVQAILELAFVAVALVLGYRMIGLLGGLLGAALVVALLSVGVVWWHLRHVPAMPRVGEPDPSRARVWFAGETGRFLRFSVFTYLLGFTGYFTQMDFAAPALAIALSTEDVALFATAFKLSFMTAGILVAGFRGVYRPLFARVRLRGDRDQLRRTFVVVTKVQLVVLMPGGLGLIVMAGDYVPLLFGTEFQAAVPLAWVLVGFLYAETMFNLPGIVLSIDERYRALVWLRAPALLTPLLFIVVAMLGGLLPAAVVFGGARLVLALVAYAFTTREYGFRFPWAFARQIGLVSLIMASVLVAGRVIWATSFAEASVLTVVGGIVFGLGLRMTGTLGTDELDLLRRTGLPGREKLAVWFDGARGDSRGQA